VVTSEETKYLIRVNGYSGSHSDGFAKYHDAAMFSTYDDDNDGNATHNCAASAGGGFWWTTCAGTQGLRSVNSQIGIGFAWYSRSYPLLTSRMWLTC